MAYLTEDELVELESKRDQMPPELAAGLDTIRNRSEGAMSRDFLDDIYRFRRYGGYNAETHRTPLIRDFLQNAAGVDMTHRTVEQGLESWSGGKFKRPEEAEQWLFGVAEQAQHVDDWFSKGEDEQRKLAGAGAHADRFRATSMSMGMVQTFPSATEEDITAKRDDLEQDALKKSGRLMYEWGVSQLSPKEERIALHIAGSKEAKEAALFYRDEIQAMPPQKQAALWVTAGAFNPEIDANFAQRLGLAVVNPTKELFDGVANWGKGQGWDLITTYDNAREWNDRLSREFGAELSKVWNEDKTVNPAYEKRLRKLAGKAAGPVAAGQTTGGVWLYNPGAQSAVESYIQNGFDLWQAGKVIRENEAIQRKVRAAMSPKYKDLGTVKELALDVAEGSVYMAELAAISMIPYAGQAAAGFMMYAPQQAEWEDRLVYDHNVDPRAAAVISTGFAAAYAAVENLQVGKIKDLRLNEYIGSREGKQMVGHYLGQYMKRGLKTSGRETVEEWTQTGIELSMLATAELGAKAEGIEWDDEIDGAFKDMIRTAVVMPGITFGGSGLIRSGAGISSAVRGEGLKGFVGRMTPEELIQLRKDKRARPMLWEAVQKQRRVEKYIDGRELINKNDVRYYAAHHDEPGFEAWMEEKGYNPEKDRERFEFSLEYYQAVGEKEAAEIDDLNARLAAIEENPDDVPLPLDSDPFWGAADVLIDQVLPLLGEGASVEKFDTQAEAQAAYPAIPADQLVKGVAFVGEKKAVMIKENLASPGAAYQTAKHEVLAHLGLAQVDGAQFIGRMREILGDELIRSMLPEYEKLIDGTDEEKASIRGEEVLAAFIERLSITKINQKMEGGSLRQRLGNWLDEALGVKGAGEMTAESIMELTRDVIEAVTSGKTGGQQSGVRSQGKVRTVPEAGSEAAADDAARYQPPADWLPPSIEEKLDPMKPENMEFLARHMATRNGTDYKAELKNVIGMRGEVRRRFLMDAHGIEELETVEFDQHKSRIDLLNDRFNSGEISQNQYARELNEIIRAKGELTGARFSVAPDLKANIEAALNVDPESKGVLPVRKVIEFSNTPEVLRFIGMPDAKIISEVGDIRKMNTKHHLSAEDIAELPNRYENPVAVFKDGDNYIILTDELAKNRAGIDKPVMVFLEPSGVKRGENNYIASAYSREIEKEQAYAQWAETAGMMRYLDMERAALLPLEEATWLRIKTSSQSGSFETPESYAPRRRNNGTTSGAKSQSRFQGSENQGGAARSRYSARSASNSEEFVPRILAGHLMKGRVIDTKMAAAILRGLKAEVPKKAVLEDYIEEAKGIFREAQKAGGTIISDRDLARAVNSAAERRILQRKLEEVKQHYFDQGAGWMRVQQEMKDNERRRVEMLTRMSTGLTDEELRAALGFNLSELMERIGEFTAPSENDMSGSTSTAEPPKPEDDLTTDSDPLMAEPADDRSGGGSGVEPEAEEKKEIKKESSAQILARVAQAVVDKFHKAGELKTNNVKNGLRKPWVLAEYQKSLRLMLRENARLFTSRNRALILSEEAGKLTEFNTLRGTNNWALKILQNTEKQRIDQTREEMVSEVWKLTDGFKGRMKYTQEDIKRAVTAKAILYYKMVREAMKLSTDAAEDRVEVLMDQLAEDKPPKQVDDVDQWRKELLTELDALMTFGALKDRSLPEIASALEFLKEDMEKQFQKQAVAQAAAESAAAAIRTSIESTQVNRLHGADSAGWFKDHQSKIMFLQFRLEQLVVEGKGEDYTSALKEMQDLAFEIATADHRKEVAVYNGNQEFGDALLAIYSEKSTAYTGEARHQFDRARAAKALRELVKLRPELQKFSVNGRALSKANLLQMVGMLAQEDYRMVALMQQELDEYVHNSKGTAQEIARRLWITDDEFAPVKWKSKHGYELNGPHLERLIVSIMGGSKLAHRLDQEAAMKAALSDKDLQLLDWFRSYYRENRQELSDMNEQITGLPFPIPKDNYIPGKVAFRRASLGGVTIVMPVTPASLTPRVFNTRDLEEEASIVELFQERLQSNMQFLHMAPIYQKVARIFNDADLRTKMENTHGKTFVSQLILHLRDVISGQPMKGGKDAAADAVVNFMAISKLGFNLSMFPKQLTSLPSFAMYTDMGDFLKYSFSAFTPEGIAAMKKLAQHDYVKARTFKGNTQVLTEMLSGFGEKNTAFWEGYKQLGSIPTRYGDILPTLVFGQGLYRALLESEDAKGMLPRQAEEWAMDKLWNIVEMSQQSGVLSNLSEWQRHGGSFARWVGQFHSTPQQFWAKEVHDWRLMTAAFRNDGMESERFKELAQQFGKTTALNFLVLGTLYNIISMIWRAMLGDLPEEEDWFNLMLQSLLSPLGGMLIIGSAITFVIEGVVTGERGYNESVSSPESVFDDLKTAGAFLHHMLTGEPEKMLEDADRILRSLNPIYRDVSRAVKNYSE